AQVMELQRSISAESMQDKIGKVYPVLVEGRSEETALLYRGRLATQAPEVDGVVYVNDGLVVSGTIQNVVITEAHDYDLVGRAISDTQAMKPWVRPNLECRPT